jgi:hypothetical protein
MDYFDEFLRKVDPFMGSLYQSLEFKCVAARRGVEWVLVTGKAVLSTEPFIPGSEISELFKLPDLVALSGRPRATSVTNLITHLRDSWVIYTHTSEKIQSVAHGAGAYNWPPPGVYSIDTTANPPSRWNKAFCLNGIGPNVSSLISYEIDGELNQHTSYNGFDGLCGNLGLPARRGNLVSSFIISAELPARFESVQLGPAKRDLEVDIECIGTPVLRVEWLPEHYMQRFPNPWGRTGPDTDAYHASVPVRDGATSADLMLDFGEILAVDFRHHNIFDEREELGEREQIGRVGGTNPGQPQEAKFETTFHSYTSGGQVGEGGAGTVFKVHNEHGELLAVKRLDPSKTTSEKLKRFENELRFCKNEAHPNIVKVPDEGFTNEGGKKAPFYVMPFYPKTLRHLMRKGIPPERILPCFAQVLDGIKAAHLQGVWHRDLKPENILYDPGTDTLVVADFGIAHFEEEGIYTAVDTNDSRRLANFLYAAPEQRTRGNEVDHRADIYALGLILNEMFTHQILQGEGYKRIESVAPQFKYLDEGVSLMVQQEPKKRPASVDAIKELLLARGDEYVSE